MRVKEIMSTALQTVDANTSADLAWETMRGNRIRHLIVTNGKSIAGILSDRDVGGRNGASIRAGHQVDELMSTDVATVPPDTTLKKAANVMRGRTIGSLVVAEKDKPVGIVTTADLLELLGRGAMKPNPTGRRPTLNFRAPHRKRNRAYGVW